MRALRALGLVAGCWCASVAISAPATSAPATVTLQIKGSITPKLIGQVKAAVAQVSGDPIPAGLIVLLDSPGGDGLAAIEIGRLLRQAQAHVFVTGSCASACVFIFMGGVVRQALSGALGIHRARLTRLDRGTQKRVDVDHQRDLSAKARLQEGDQKIRAYVQEMGVLAQFSAAMNEVPPERMRWLSQAEGRDLGVIGFDPQYFAARRDFVFQRLGTNPRDLERFTERVLPRCREEAVNPKGNFVRCYRLNLN